MGLSTNIQHFYYKENSIILGSHGNLHALHLKEEHHLTAYMTYLFIYLEDQFLLIFFVVNLLRLLLCDYTGAVFF